jgi:hypothetical protein
MKICTVGVGLFSAEDGRTDMTQLVVYFRNLAKVPINRHVKAMK